MHLKRQIKPLIYSSFGYVPDFKGPFFAIMKNNIFRRDFIKKAGLAGLGLGVTFPSILPAQSTVSSAGNKRIGIIGLDTSHSTNIMQLLNGDQPFAGAGGYTVVAAYPYGSRDIKSSYERIPAYIKEAQALGVEVVDSIAALLKKVDVVLLETNDGKPRLAQALEVIGAGKKLFIDKPVAAAFKDVVAIFKAAAKNKVPIFSSSSLRYTPQMEALLSGEKIGKITGVDTYSPAPLQPGHIDLAWYGLHGVEPLFALMGIGCRELRRVYTAGTDMVVGKWKDGRVGTFRGMRTGATDYGGTAFGEKGIAPVGSFAGYEGLLTHIIRFFNSGVSPVPAGETLEIYAFMEAADWSRARGGAAVTLQEVYDRYRLHA